MNLKWNIKKHGRATDMEGRPVPPPPLPPEDRTEKVRFCVDPKSGLTRTAVAVMLLSMVFRLVGCWGLWADELFLKTQIILPLACNLLFAATLLLCGRKAFWVTTIPAIFGVVFFIIKAFTFDSMLHTVLCVLLYILVAVLYTGTAFGAIRTKWLLVPLFGLPLVYHLAIEDRMALQAGTFTFQTGMQELSVICIMLSLLLTALAMKRKKPEGLPPDLPKMKAPKVIVPVPQAPEEPEQCESNTEETVNESTSQQKENV